MTDREQLCKSIASTIADYRVGELPRPDADHVGRWVSQFDAVDQNVILEEMSRILECTYISRQRACDFLDGLVEHKEIVGTNPHDYWRNVNMISSNQVGGSQRALLELLGERVYSRLGIPLEDTQRLSRRWLYLDDGIFSGKQIIEDISTWAELEAMEQSHLDIVVFGVHEYGCYRLKKEILEGLAKRSITHRIWRIRTFENRKTYRRNSDVLWPVELPNVPIVHEWKALRNLDTDHFHARPLGLVGKVGLFSTDEARQVLERAFLIKGAYICTLGEKHHWAMKPLGFTGFRNVGFGSLLCTYRNCPNNAPLVLWWGDPTRSPPLGKWYPLLQRKVRQPTAEPYDDDDESFDGWTDE